MAGGVAVLAQRLAEAGLLHEDAPTVTGQTIGEIAATARDTLDHMRDVIWLLAPKAGTWQDLSHRLESVANRLLDGIDHDVRVTGEPPAASRERRVRASDFPTGANLLISTSDRPTPPKSPDPRRRAFYQAIKCVLANLQGQSQMKSGAS